MTTPTSEWTKILIHPLGLTGYALFLLFGLLARAKRHDERRWILPTALLAAGIALLGGIGLAYRDLSRQIGQTIIVPASTPAATLQQQNKHVSQTSTSAGSPNVQGVQGNVTISVDQSSDRSSKTQTQRAKFEEKPEDKTQ